MDEEVELDLLNSFQASDPAAHPDSHDLRGQVRRWIDSEVTDRSDFYTADEAEAPEFLGTPKARAKAKSNGPGDIQIPQKFQVGERLLARSLLWQGLRSSWRWL